MTLPSRVSRLLGNLLRRRRVEHDLDDELRAFVEMAADEKREAGLPEREARRAALLEMGGIEQVKERVREGRAGAALEQLGQDLSHGCRMLAKNPGFTVLALATLCLGVGASTAAFSVVDTVLFRPLPYGDPSRIVKVWSIDAKGRHDLSMPDFLDVARRGRVFEDVAADDGSDVTLSRPDGTREYLSAGFVTANWLRTLGVRPALGRDFLAEEQQQGRDRGWRRRFASDPLVVGSTLVIDGESVTVVGVLPPNVLRYGADVLKPLVQARYSHASDRSFRDLDVFARLAPAVSMAQAQADVDTLARLLATEHPATNGERGFRLEPLAKWYAAVPPKAERGLLLMLGATGLVLLIACANVASLLFGRAVVRRRECVIRSALGASRGRLVRQLLTENALLFLLGGALGVLLAQWSVDALVAFAVRTGYVPGAMAVALDARVLAFSLALALGTGALFGLAPALQASRVDSSEALRESAPSAGAGPRRRRTRRALVVSELALAVVLLTGFGLLIRSVLRLQAVPPGFDPRNVLIAGSGTSGPFREQVDYWRAALERARVSAEVESVAVTSRPPLRRVRAIDVAVEAGPAAPAQVSRAGDVFVSPGYFDTVKVPLLKGRAFTEADDEGAPLVAIVSHTLARRHFGRQDPLGRRVRVEASPRLCCTGAVAGGVWEIVGVVADVRQVNLDEEPAATLYRPYLQIVEHDMDLLVRARSASAPLARLVDGRLRERGEWGRVAPMQRLVDGSESLQLRRFVLILLGGFAAVAVALGAIGVYGVMAYSVAERTREIGVRVALGATGTRVVRHVLGETLALAAVGLGLGWISAQLLSRFLSSLLFGVGPSDAVTCLAVSILLALMALLASYLPARRASRVDPIVALRHE